MKELLESWPAMMATALCIIAIPALIILKAPLSRLLDRTTSINKDGASFSQNEAKPKEEAVLTFEGIMGIPVSHTVLSRSELILERFRKMKVSNEEDRLKALARSSAIIRIAAEFDNIARIIFGSQMQLLVRITSNTNPTPEGEAQQIFRDAAAAQPQHHKDRTYDMWIGFLESHNLILRKNGQIDITQSGLDFLKYLVESRQTYERVG